MAGRQRALLIDDPRLLRRAPPPPAALMEERIIAHHREIQALLLDKQRLAATQVAMKRDLSLAEKELQQLGAAARKVREERELEVKDVYQKSVKIESEFRVNGIDSLKAELAQVKADVLRLTEGNIELTSQLNSIDTELARAKLEVTDVPAIRADIDNMRKELHKGRAAIEFEKKTRTTNLETSHDMEKYMVSTQREIEKLLAELANSDKRARAAAAAAANPNPGYMGNYAATHNMTLGGGPYPHYAMHQAQSMVDVTPTAPYGASGGDPDMQQTHAPRG